MDGLRLGARSSSPPRSPSAAGRQSASRCCGGSLFTAIATWVLFKTRIGNWIFAVGGDAGQRPRRRCPVTKVKIGLFMFVGFCAWFVGMHLLFAFNTVQSGQGIGNEFFYSRTL